MLTTSRKLLQAGTITTLLMALACGENAGLPGVTPSVAIRSPTNDSSVNLSGTGELAVGFDTNYTLRAPGACAGQDNCGHIYLLVDSSSCNAPNRPYNNLAVASPTSADFSRCPTRTGMHTITLELHRDDGSVVNGVFGSPVTDDVTITTQ